MTGLGRAWATPLEIRGVRTSGERATLFSNCVCGGDPLAVASETRDAAGFGDPSPHSGVSSLRAADDLPVAVRTAGGPAQGALRTERALVAADESLAVPRQGDGARLTGGLHEERHRSGDHSAPQTGTQGAAREGNAFFLLVGGRDDWQPRQPEHLLKRDLGREYPNRRKGTR